MKIDWERDLRRLKNWVSLNHGIIFKPKFNLLVKNWMQSYFWFLKLMPLGQNKGKSTCWLCPKIKNLKIGFDTWIPFSFLIKKHHFNFLVVKSWIYRHLVFVPSEAPLSINFQNWTKSLGLHDLLPNRQPNFGCLAWKFFGLNYSSNHNPHLEKGHLTIW